MKARWIWPGLRRRLKSMRNPRTLFGAITPFPRVIVCLLFSFSICHALDTGNSEGDCGTKEVFSKDQHVQPASINVLDFGADPTFTNDSSAAFRSWWAACTSRVEGLMLLLVGTIATLQKATTNFCPASIGTLPIIPTAVATFVGRGKTHP